MASSTERFEHRQNRFGPLIHSQREAFGDEYITEAIHDQTGQTVRFRVNDTIGIRHGVEFQQSTTEFECGGKSVVPPRLIGTVNTRLQQPHGHLGARVEEAEPLSEPGCRD